MPSGFIEAVGSRSRGGAGGSRRLPPSSPLSTHMDQFAQGFYRVMNCDPALPDVDAQQKGAAEAFIKLMTRGLDQIPPSPVPAQQQQGGQYRVAYGEANGGAVLDQKFRADKDMFVVAVRLLARVHQLPLNSVRLQRPTKPQSVSSIKEAAQLAAGLDVLLTCMEMTQGCHPNTFTYNTLLSALCRAQQPIPAAALFDRMRKGLKGDATPDTDSWRQVFTAHLTSPDLSGALHILREVPEDLAWLRGQWRGRLLHAGTLKGDWDIARQVLAEMKESPTAYKSDAAFQMHMDTLLNTMLMAAQADKLSIAMQAWEQIQANVPQGDVCRLQEGQVLQVLTAAGRSPDIEVARTVATKVFDAFVTQLQSQHAAAQAKTGDDDSKPQPVPLHPRPPMYLQVITILCHAQDWPEAFEVAHQLEVHWASQLPAVVSAYQGLSPLAEAMASRPGAVASAYDSLIQRQAMGKPVTSALMNVVLRGLALTGAVEQASRLFEEYPVAGLQHDMCSFNAVIESCMVAGKPAAAIGVLEYMTSQGFIPSTDTFDMVLKTLIAARDPAAARDVLIQLRRTPRATVRVKVLYDALQLATDEQDSIARDEFAQELEHLRNRPQI